MFGELVSLAIYLLAWSAAPLAVAPALLERLPSLARTQATPAYRADDRSVDNWRAEAARNLDLDPERSLAIAGDGEAPSVPRCVKLNNYWCIKGVGWNGMVAADPEGHAAFASAPEGAAVAALLLRRYYLDFSRRSAMDIVSRWAPAQCGASPVRTTQFGKGFRLAQTRVPLGAEPGKRAAPLATRGLGNTLRARFLASRGRGPRGARAGLRRSAIPDRAPPMLRTPTIAAGLGAMETPLSLPGPLALLNLAARVTPSSFAPMSTCADDGARVRNYALKIIEGVAKSPDEDLKLFAPDGTPSDNLARVLLNMAAVEVGPLRATPVLVRAGVETAVAAARLAAEARAGQAAEPGR